MERSTFLVATLALGFGFAVEKGLDVLTGFFFKS